MVSLLYLLCLAPSVLAQYGDTGSSTTSAAATTTSSAASSTQTIAVGQNGLQFSPNSVVVAPGKTVVFQFYPGNHSLVEGSFDSPCQPLSSSSFFSGFIDSSSGPAPNAFTIPVNSTDPIWFYCGQVGHCKTGMVGVINPPASGQTLDQYKSAAAGSSGSSTPASVQGGTVAAPSSSTPSSTNSPKPAAGHREFELGGGFFCAVLTVLLAFAF